MWEDGTWNAEFISLVEMVVHIEQNPLASLTHLEGFFVWHWILLPRECKCDLKVKLLFHIWRKRISQKIEFFRREPVWREKKNSNKSSLAQIIVKFGSRGKITTPSYMWNLCLPRRPTHIWHCPGSVRQLPLLSSSSRCPTGFSSSIKGASDFALSSN